MYWLLSAISLRLRSVFRLQSFHEHFHGLAEDFVLLGWQRSETGGGIQVIEGLFGVHVI
jgi:hypothetical protein